MTGLETLIAGAAIKESTGPAKAFISKFGRPKYDRFIVEFCRCFDSHIANSYERCKYVKNVLYRDNSVELITQYVNIRFDQGDKQINDSEVSGLIRSGGKMLISGTAGAGKTMFMKWLTLDLIESIAYHQRIPLFLELRYLTEETIKGGIIRYILENTSPSESRVEIERFKIGLELGQFILILDAVDEIKPAIREKAVEEIRLFVKDYPRCSILVSSRPDDELESIQELTVYRTRNMDKAQVELVVERLDFDSTVKGALLSKLQTGLFEEHEEFLSNPLLVTIMLLNFDHSADIPTKLTSFYRQAFEALYQRHDAAKGAYRRGHYAGLPLDEYEKVFSAFCFDSFLDTKVEFSDSELLDYFRAAATYFNVGASPQSLVEDARKSVCVIQREGLDNVFAHRTFQEYFTALFLSRYREDDYVDQVKNTTHQWHNNNVLKMLLELAPEPVEQEWLEPSFRKTANSLRRIKPTTKAGMTKIFTAFFSSMDVDTETGDVTGFSNNLDNFGGVLSTIGMSYNPPSELTRSVFRGLPIFDSLEAYIESNADIGMPSGLLRRIDVSEVGDEADGDDEAVSTIEITADDIPWLIKSNLSLRLDTVRLAFLSFYDAMLDRIQQRSSAMERLRTRHSASSPIRRSR